MSTKRKLTNGTLSTFGLIVHYAPGEEHEAVGLRCSCGSEVFSVYQILGRDDCRIACPKCKTSWTLSTDQIVRAE